MSDIPAWPAYIERQGPYKVYKGTQYTVYDDGNSAETPYQTDLAEAALARLRVAVEALRTLAHPDSVCKYIAQEALEEIGEIPE